MFKVQLWGFGESLPWVGGQCRLFQSLCVYLQHIPTSGRGRKGQRRKGNKTLSSPLENHILLRCGTWKFFACISPHSTFMWNHRRFRCVDVHRWYLVGFAVGWVTRHWPTCARIQPRNKFLIRVGLWRLKQSLLKPYTLFPVTNSRSLPVEYISSYSFGFEWLLSCFVGQIFRRGL